LQLHARLVEGIGYRHTGFEAQKGRSRHANATEMRPKSLSGYCVVGLFKVNQGSMQPGRVSWLFGAGSMLQVPKDEHGLYSVLAWVETKLCVRYLAFQDAPSCEQGANDIWVQ